MAGSAVLFVVVALLALAGVGLAALFVRYELLERRFRRVYVEDSEETLLRIVGEPSEVRLYRPPGAASGDPPMREYWYKIYVATDGWTVLVDADGTIMQIRRLDMP